MFRLPLTPARPALAGLRRYASTSLVRAPLLAPLLVVLSAALAPVPALAGTLDVVRARGVLQCGVNNGLAGFAAPDHEGHWRGLNADLCRAIAAAVLGDAGKVTYAPLSAQARFTALQSGEIDVLVDNNTFTEERDVALGLRVTTPIYYGGEGMMVPRTLNVTRLDDLDGASICMLAGSTNGRNLTDRFRGEGKTFEPVVVDSLDDVLRVFHSGRCDALTSDLAVLAASRAALSGNPDDYIILPDVISKAPLGPMVRQGDEQWLNIVNWTIHAMVAAEELGVTSTNADYQRDHGAPGVRRMLGATPGFAAGLGVADEWGYNVVKQVGNYAEVFHRNLGAGSPLKLARGLNALWSQGGLLYALPLR